MVSCFLVLIDIFAKLIVFQYFIGRYPVRIAVDCLVLFNSIITADLVRIFSPDPDPQQFSWKWADLLL
jgi:hypothetical protein